MEREDEEEDGRSIAPIRWKKQILTEGLVIVKHCSAIWIRSRGEKPGSIMKIIVVDW